MDYQPLINKYLKRLKGYISSPRQEILFLKFYLNDHEYVLYTVLRDLIVDWDKTHDLYGNFTYDPDQIAQYTGWKLNKVKRVFKNLNKLGFCAISKSSQKIYKLSFYGEFSKMQKDGYLKDLPFKYILDVFSELCSIIPQNNPKLLIKLEDIKTEARKYVATAMNFDSIYRGDLVNSSGDLDYKNTKHTPNGSEDLSFDDIKDIFNKIK